VGIVRRVPERAVDARLQLLRDHVLEPVRFVVHVVDVQPERLREVELEQAVMADHLDRDALAGLGEPSAAVGLVVEEPERAELLQHRGRRRGRDPLVARNRSDGHAPLRVLKLVDRLQVVLDRH